jgi:hypothetical protein
MSEEPAGSSIDVDEILLRTVGPQQLGQIRATTVRSGTETRFGGRVRQRAPTPFTYSPPSSLPPPRLFPHGVRFSHPRQLAVLFSIFSAISPYSPVAFSSRRSSRNPGWLVSVSRLSFSKHDKSSRVSLLENEHARFSWQIIESFGRQKPPSLSLSQL